MSEIKQLLLAYSQQRASTNDVMRSLLSHRDWFAPLALFAQDGGQARSVDGIMVLSTEGRITPGEL
jgi:hypothetical protein